MIDKTCIIRTYSAGVFWGVLDTHDAATGTATLRDSRRIWAWTGATELTQVANHGVGEGSRVSETARRRLVAEVIEIIPTTEEANQSIGGQPDWVA